MNRRRISIYARSLGITIGWRDSAANPRFKYAYSRGHVAAYERSYGVNDLTAEESVLHEISHFICAPPSRRYQPNYGLGPSPVAEEYRESTTAMEHSGVLTEESLVCYLTAALVATFGGDPIRVLSCLGCETGVQPDGCPWNGGYWTRGLEDEDFWKAISELQRLGIMKGGSVTGKLRAARTRIRKHN